jgi:hypothetical protein
VWYSMLGEERSGDAVVGLEGGNMHECRRYDNIRRIVEVLIVHIAIIIKIIISCKFLHRR